MRYSGGGYTFVEVMLVMAISGAVLITAFTAVSGKQGNVRFQTAVKEVESKIADWSNDVIEGYPGGESRNYNCTLRPDGATQRPTIGTAVPTKNSYCIFVGKAIQFIDKNFNGDYSKKIYAYSVFGSRLNTTTGEPPVNLSQASLIGATGGGGANPPGSVDLTDIFEMPAGLRVKSVTGSPNASATVIGLFLNFNVEGAAGSNGNLHLLAYALNNNGSMQPYDFGGGNVTNCLKLSGPCSGVPAQLQRLEVCLEDSLDIDKTAKITLTSLEGSGISSKSEIMTC